MLNLFVDWIDTFISDQPFQIASVSTSVGESDIDTNPSRPWLSASSYALGMAEARSPSHQDVLPCMVYINQLFPLCAQPNKQDDDLLHLPMEADALHVNHDLSNAVHPLRSCRTLALSLLVYKLLTTSLLYPCGTDI